MFNKKCDKFHAYRPYMIIRYSYVSVCSLQVSSRARARELSRRLIPMLLLCIRMLMLCIRMLLVCIRMLLVCIRMLLVCTRVTRMYSYVLVCTRVYSCVLVCPRMYSYVNRMLPVLPVCSFSHDHSVLLVPVSLFGLFIAFQDV